MCPRLAEFIAEVGPPAPAPKVLRGASVQIGTQVDGPRAGTGRWDPGASQSCNYLQRISARSARAGLALGLPQPDPATWHGFWGRVGRRSFTPGLSQNGAGVSRRTPLP